MWHLPFCFCIPRAHAAAPIYVHVYVRVYVQALAVLSFENDEKIIMKDEEATFCGIVLDGVVGAVINDRLTIPLDKGNVIGEMSYFEGGSRSCDMVTLSPCYLGVIKFEEVEGLGMRVSLRARVRVCM